MARFNTLTLAEGLLKLIHLSGSHLSRKLSPSLPVSNLVESSPMVKSKRYNQVSNAI
jgi:hypothetical protein